MGLWLYHLILSENLMSATIITPIWGVISDWASERLSNVSQVTQPAEKGEEFKVCSSLPSFLPSCLSSFTFFFKFPSSTSHFPSFSSPFLGISFASCIDVNCKHAVRNPRMFELKPVFSRHFKSCYGNNTFIHLFTHSFIQVFYSATTVCQILSYVLGL